MLLCLRTYEIRSTVDGSICDPLIYLTIEGRSNMANRKRYPSVRAKSVNFDYYVIKALEAFYYDEEIL